MGLIFLAKRFNELGKEVKDNKLKSYIFESVHYRCKFCKRKQGDMAEIISTKKLKEPIKFRVKMQLHTIKTSQKIYYITLCTKCHYIYHYFAKMTDETIEQWMKETKNRVCL